MISKTKISITTSSARLAILAFAEKIDHHDSSTDDYEMKFALGDAVFQMLDTLPQNIRLALLSKANRWIHSQGLERERFQTLITHLQSSE